MSENVETKAPETPAIPPEVLAEVSAQIDQIKTMNKEQLLAYLKDLGHDFPAEATTEAWLQRKAKMVAQKVIFEKHGLNETPKIKKNHEKTDAAKPEGGEVKKVGRKKMEKSGEYKLTLGEDGNMGREGSVKHDILTYIADLGKPTFTFKEFELACIVASKYDADNKVFGVNTKFPSIEALTNAWWSELKNKAKVIASATE